MNDDGKIQIAIRFKSRSTILFDYWNIRFQCPRFDLHYLRNPSVFDLRLWRAEKWMGLATF